MESTTTTKRVIGLTMGDPAGVGPELCLRALLDPGVRQLCHPVLFGQVDVLRRVSEQLHLPVPEASVYDAPLSRRPGEIAFVNCPVEGLSDFEVGKVSAACGKSAYASIEAAIVAARSELIDAVVTAPIHKESLRMAGVVHPGHTEIFTALTETKRSCMMLRSDVLTVSMVTTHIGYKQVPEAINKERVLDVIELTHEAVSVMNGRPARLGVCGLNPHAGENGLFGNREEERLILPALREAQASGMDVVGPLPPDTAFTESRRRNFDAVVCMYHDQGHIPFKMLAFEDGVNITLGLPIIRTSVDHGTAFDIAWKGTANPRSLFSAIKAAVALTASTREPINQAE